MGVHSSFKTLVENLKDQKKSEQELSTVPLITLWSGMFHSGDTSERVVTYLISVSYYFHGASAAFVALHPAVRFKNKRKVAEKLTQSPKGMFCLRSAW